MPNAQLYPLTVERRATALAALSRLRGRPVRVLSETPAGRPWAPVTRLALDADVPGTGSRVIVKTRRVEGAGFGGDAFLRREAAGLRVADASGVVPDLLDVDDGAGVLLLADLGEWPTLQDLLLGRDAGSAASGVRDLGVALGRMHAATRGRREEHQAALDAVAGDMRWSRNN